MNEKMSGVCKWFHIQKGYGFVKGIDGIEYFVHYKQIVGDGYKKIEEGQTVFFKPDNNQRGPLAAEVEGL